MIPTLIGIVVLLVGTTLLVSAPLPAMLSLVMVCALMGGSAAFVLPALGGSSIPPAQFALGFLVLRIALPGSGLRHAATAAIRANILLVAFVAYGITMAMLAPRIFAGQIAVVPMRIADADIFATSPLAPSAQNITASVYLTGTMLAAICGHVAMRDPGGPRALVRTAVVVAWIHIFLGVSGVVLKGTAWTRVLEFFRNGSYSQLNQQIGDVVRMNGIMPEPSTFAGFGLVWFLFLVECWFRDVLPRRTGPAALAMAATLVASTSSTAYVGLAGYAAIVALRSLLFPSHLPPAKLLTVGAVLLGLGILVSAGLLLAPSAFDRGWAILLDMTVNKQDSKSGIQRAFWAAQGLTAFVQSQGLGIGPGSFRSSSLVTAIVGATGVLGAALFLAYVLSVLKPWRATTFSAPAPETARIGVAASWAAVCLLIPAGVAGAGADPGSEFALLAGAALSLRRVPAGRLRAMTRLDLRWRWRIA